MTAKEQVKMVLGQLPDDCTVEDVQYELYVLEKLRRRVEMADRGEALIPQSEVEERMQKWSLG